MNNAEILEWLDDLGLKVLDTSDWVMVFDPGLVKPLAEARTLRGVRTMLRKAGWR